MSAFAYRARLPAVTSFTVLARLGVLAPFSAVALLAWPMLLPAPGLAAQDLPDASEPSMAEPCPEPEHRQFDFWLGRWEVRNPAGELVGHNEITREAGGCALLERWQGVGGSRGVSVNGYDPDRGLWSQRWIGAGAVLWLEGGLDGEAMVLTGTSPRSTPQGEVVDRITWTPQEDGRVRQVWEVGVGSGAWREIFNGVYSRSSSASPHREHVEPADVASPEAVVRAMYETINRPPGEPFDWDRFRGLFLPQATMIPSLEQTGGAFRVMSVEDFISWVDEQTTVGGPTDRGFREEQIASRTERYGDIAQVFSTYQKRFRDDTEILGRGINSIQLVHTEGRWWVAAVAWDEEVGAGPLPERYLPEGG